MNTSKLNFWFKLRDGSEIGQPVRKAFKQQAKVIKPVHHNSLWHALEKENPQPRRAFAVDKPDASIELDSDGNFVLSKPVKPGDTVFISGGPADGRYDIKGDKVLIVNNGQVVEYLSVKEFLQKQKGGF